MAPDYCRALFFALFQDHKSYCTCPMRPMRPSFRQLNIKQKYFRNSILPQNNSFVVRQIWRGRKDGRTSPTFPTYLYVFFSFLFFLFSFSFFFFFWGGGEERRGVGLIPNNVNTHYVAIKLVTQESHEHRLPRITNQALTIRSTNFLPTWTRW